MKIILPKKIIKTHTHTEEHKDRDTYTPYASTSYLYMPSNWLSPSHHYSLSFSHSSSTFSIPKTFHLHLLSPQFFLTKLVSFNSVAINSMGSSLSFLAADGSTASAPSPEPGLGDLPESCVASVLVHLDPPQICRLAMLNRAFRGASSADFVWESKLPVNYGDVIGRVFEEDDSFSKGLCKRDIYARLCRANSFDGGTKVRFLCPF